LILKSNRIHLNIKLTHLKVTMKSKLTIHIFITIPFLYIWTGKGCTVQL